MYALSKDKLIMEIDKSLFTLMLNILNLDEEACIKDNEADELYERLVKRCNELFIKIGASGDEESSTTPVSSAQNSPNAAGARPTEAKKTSVINKDTIAKQAAASYNKTVVDAGQLNARLLAFECLLSINLSKQPSGIADWCRNEARRMKSFEYILNQISSFLESLISITNDQFSPSTKPNKSNAASQINNTSFDINKFYYLINKFQRSLCLLQALTQSQPFLSTTTSNNNMHTFSDAAEASAAELNQNYLVDCKHVRLLDLLKK
jgi:hypothetical protein